MTVLRPELPTEGRANPRDYLFVMDSSHSTGKQGWNVQPGRPGGLPGARWI